MPNWKKVIVSGSDAILNEITASGGVQVGADILPDSDNTLSLGSSDFRFQLNGGTPVTVTGSGTNGTVTRFSGSTEVENSTITNTDSLTVITHDNDGNDILIVSGANGELLKVTDSVDNTLFQVNDGSGIAKLEVSSSGLTTTSDVEIDDWGSVSASLASINATGSNQNLQQVTDNGNTTTNDIIVSGSITISGDDEVLTLTGGNTIETDHTDESFNKKTCANGAVTNLFSVMHSTYVGAVLDYAVYTTDRNNQRTGMVTVTANSSTVKHSELVTTDIGNTDGVIVTSKIAGTFFEVDIDNDSGNSFDIVYSFKLLKV